MKSSKARLEVTPSTENLVQDDVDDVANTNRSFDQDSLKPISKASNEKLVDGLENFRDRYVVSGLEQQRTSSIRKRNTS